jgi:hypothetical protein
MMSTHVLPGTDPDGSISTAYFLAAGRASALFAVLAGVGVALANGGPGSPIGSARRAAAAGIIARAVILTLIGLFLGGLDSGVAVILVNYGFLFLLASLFIHLPVRRLAILAIGWGIASPLISHWLRGNWPTTSFEVTGFDSLLDPVRMLREVWFTGYYPVFTWVTYLLAGLAVGRIDLGSRTVVIRLVGIGAALAIAAKVLSATLLQVLGGAAVVGELPVQFLGVTPTDSWWYLVVATPHSGTTLDFAHTIGTSLLVLGGCSLLANAGRRTLAWLAAAGGMTLTLYTAHVLALSAGWGLSDRLALLAWHGVLALIIGLLWRGLVGRGPLEALTASVVRSVRSAVLDRPPAISREG